jgi:hypothetical protein
MNASSETRRIDEPALLTATLLDDAATRERAALRAHAEEEDVDAFAHIDGRIATNREVGSSSCSAVLRVWINPSKWIGA